jgi:hypothetical protein
MKSALELNNPVHNFLDPFHREQMFKVTGLKFQVCSVPGTKLQAVKGNISWRRYKECVHIMRKNVGIWCIWMDFDCYGLAFRRNISSTSSGSKNKPRKKTAEAGGKLGLSSNYTALQPRRFKVTALRTREGIICDILASGQVRAGAVIVDARSV